MNYSYAQLEGLWTQAGGSAALAPIMAAIALAESSGNPSATNPNDNNGTQTSWGLWQISNGTHNKPTADILDPETNAEYAVKKYKAQGLSAWGTYTSGRYRQFLKSGVNPSPVTGTTPTTAQDASITSDLGNAIGQGLLGVVQPLVNYLLWGSEVVLGLVLLVGGVFTALQASKTVRNVEKTAIKGAIPETRGLPQRPKTTAKKVEKPSTGRVRGIDVQSERADIKGRKAAIRGASPEYQEMRTKRAEDARVSDVRRRMTAERSKARAKTKKAP